MNAKRHKILTVAVVIFLTATTFYTVFVTVNEPKDAVPSGFQATAIGLDRYGNCIVDISDKDIFDRGYELNDYVHLSWDEHEVRAIVVTNYIGLYTFEYFINISDSGIVTIACQFAIGSLSIGDVITVSYLGPSHREDLMPNYSKDVSGRKEGMTDEEYANYRNVTTSGIGSGTLYRSYNEYIEVTDVRSGCVDPLLKDRHISHIIYMDESLESLKSNIASGKVVTDNGSYYIDNGKIFAEYMSVKFIEDVSYRKVLEYIADNDGPYLIFCSLGKDRTGFVITLLEAFMGASYDEMFEDYSRSYECLYGVKKGTEEYETLHKLFDPVICGIHDPSIMKHIDTIDISEIDVSGYDYQKDAENFMSKTLGISDDKIDKIREHLKNST